MLNVTVHQYQIIPDYVKTQMADLLDPAVTTSIRGLGLCLSAKQPQQISRKYPSEVVFRKAPQKLPLFIGGDAKRII